jgi:hypothetical protein
MIATTYSSRTMLRSFSIIRIVWAATGSDSFRQKSPRTGSDSRIRNRCSVKQTSSTPRAAAAST